MFCLRNETGFGLIEAMLAAGVIAIISLSVAGLMLQNAKTQNRIETLQNRNTLATELQMLANASSAICSAHLVSGQHFDLAKASSNEGLEISLNLLSGKKAAKSESLREYKVMIESLTLSNAFDTQRMSAIGNKIYKGRLNLEVSPINNSMVGGPKLGSQVVGFLSVEVDGNNLIVGCAEESTTKGPNAEDCEVQSTAGGWGSLETDADGLPKIRFINPAVLIQKNGKYYVPHGAFLEYGAQVTPGRTCLDPTLTCISGNLFQTGWVKSTDSNCVDQSN